MNRSRNIRRYLLDAQGSTAAEFALISIFFIGLCIGIIDLARFAWEFNSAKAATRVGARVAAVSPIVADQMIADLPDTYSPGERIPEDEVPIYECFGATSTCTGEGSGSAPFNATVFATILSAMQGYYPRVQAANVVVRYQHVGIGFVGNPFGPDIEPLVTVRLVNMGFTPGSLAIFGVTNLSIPSVASTMSGEDYAFPSAPPPGGGGGPKGK